MRKRVVSVGTIVLLTYGLAIATHIEPADAQSTAPLKRIGVLTQFGCPVPPDSLARRRLAELGWIEGRTFAYDCVSAVGRLDQIESLAAELVARRPDVIGANPVLFVRELKRATATIPIVMWSTPDPVGTGLVTNLARPEANVTGVAWFGFDILPKRIELLKEILPHLQRLAIIYAAHADPKVIDSIEANATTAAKALNFSWQMFRPAAPEDYDKIFSRLADEGFDAAYIQPNPLSQTNTPRIVELALRYHMPAIGDDAWSARAGLLLGYGADFSHDLVRYAEYVDKILRGAKPSELPVEQATKLELAINQRTAKALGLTVPPALLARANEVIE